MSVFIMKYFYDKLSRLIGGHIRNVRFPMLCRGANKGSSCLGYKINTLGSLTGRTGLHNERASTLEPRQMTLTNTTSSSISSGDAEIGSCRSMLGSISVSAQTAPSREEHLQVTSRAHNDPPKICPLCRKYATVNDRFVKGRQ
jgi:hypothetical protein